MHHFFDAITNTKGDALLGYYVRVVDSDGLGVPLYADTNLTPIVSVSGVADAAKVDNDGNVDFYADAGTYRLDIYGTDAVTLVKSIRDVPMAEIVDLAGSTATRYIGTSISVTGAVARTVADKLGDTVSVKDFGAKGDGTTDDTDAIQAALNTGKRVYLDPAVTYAFGSQLIPPSGGGFVGRGKLLMLTGTGKFDKADWTGDPLTYSGIFIDGASDVTINARIQMQANAAIRACNAIWVRNSTNVNLDIEAWGFQEARYGIVEWNSNIGGSVRANIHDCYSDSTTLPALQITGLSVDNNRIDLGSGPVNSTGLRFDVVAKDIYFGPNALATYSYQTDAVSLFGQGSTRHIGRINSENVYEPLDCWSDHNIIDVIAKDAVFGAKLMYGASDNVIRATVDRFMKNGLFFGVGNTQSVARNRVYLTATGGGEIGSFAEVSAVCAEGGVTLAPDRNYVEVTAHGDGVNLDYGVLVTGNSSNNRFLVEANGCAVAVANIDTASAGPGNVIKRQRPSLVRANLSANTVYPALATIVCNAESIDKLGEYDPATGIWTATSSATIRATLTASLSVDAGLQYGSYLTQHVAGGSTLTISKKRNTNGGASGSTRDHYHSAIIEVSPGDQVYFRADDGTGAGLVTWFGGASSTYIEIEEL